MNKKETLLWSVPMVLVVAAFYFKAVNDTVFAYICFGCAMFLFLALFGSDIKNKRP